MISRLRYHLFSALSAGAFWLLLSPNAGAQSPATGARGYDFLTVTTIEAGGKSDAKLLLVPAFEGRSEVPLANANFNYFSRSDFEKLAQNTQLINQQLGALTVAGWELVQVYPVPTTIPVAPAGSHYSPPITRYLFRKPRL